ncbi:MAG: hypothetical protein Q9162_004259 [Coniocarpon cinnabarinum]
MLLAILLFFGGAFAAPTPQVGGQAGVPISINVANTDTKGYATSSNLNTGIYRDNGGGACVNGLCVIGFSDTTVCNGPFQTNGGDALTSYCKSISAGNADLPFNSFAHNTFATFDAKQRNANAHPPQALYDFGKHAEQNGQPAGQVLPAPLGPEADEQSIAAFAMWPNSKQQAQLKHTGSVLTLYAYTGNMVSVPSAPEMGPNDVVGVSNVLSVNGKTYYNSLYKLTVTDDVPDGQNIPAERIVPQLFQFQSSDSHGQENLYGTYALMASHTNDCKSNGQEAPCLYLFARNSPKSWDTMGGGNHNGIKVARVAQASILDKGQYEYWDGSNWVAQQPDPLDRQSEFISSDDFFLDTGEFFWSNHYNKYVHVAAWMGKFTIRYSDSITSGWSEPQDLYQGEKPGSLQGYMYGGHVYPDWDPSGQSLLLSWTCDEMWTQMAVVNFT